MFRLELLPAAYGDCILITYGSGRYKRLVLIDAGTEPTWKNALRQRLDPPVKLQLFVLTHIDADHIAGGIPLLKEGTNVEIADIWFNGWRHLPKNVLSAMQGEVFSTLIRERQLEWNGAFGGQRVAVDGDTLPERTLPGGLRLTVLSPTPRMLGRLARQWKKQIERKGLRPGDHRRFRRFLARHPTLSTNVPKLASLPFKGDTSAPNGSSIALLAEYDGKAVLLAGDAYASVLSQSISRLLESREQRRLPLAACKVSHHGSRGNTNRRLLELLDCTRFLISCNGDLHNLPDNETIGRIVQHTSGTPEIVFNYDCKRTRAWKSKTLQKRYGYVARYGEEGYISMEL
jgi:beta-lactamase superfamily II metal-dependent hydrolase